MDKDEVANNIEKMTTDEIKHRMGYWEKMEKAAHTDSLRWHALEMIVLWENELARRSVMVSRVLDLPGTATEFWFCTTWQRDVFLNLMGYMFEQSIPLRGMAYLYPFTEMTQHELLEYGMTSKLPARCNHAL